MTLTPLVAFAAAVVVVVAANLFDNRLAPKAYLLTSLVVTALLLALFGTTGLPRADAGLGAGWPARGARWGLVLVAAVAAGYLVGALLPATRNALVDLRTAGARPATVAYQMFVRITVGTVLLEEVAFRGVLYGLLRQPYGTAVATVASAALFGLWHVPVAAALPRANPAAGRLFARRPALVVPATVVATGLAGAVLCELQRRSGSLLTPAALHWAVNALGYLTAYLVTRRSTP